MMNVDNDERSTHPESPFATFYRDAYPRFARLAYLLCGSVPLAEDLVQEAFTQVHSRFEKLDEPSVYLRVTMVNLARRNHRSAVREERRLRLVHDPTESTGMHANEMLDVLARLPHDQRELIVLRFWADLSEAEIAEATNCRPGTVKSRCARALARMRKELQP
jgi:RNA polymerase sigma-70 factor (sigma-E family)